MFSSFTRDGLIREDISSLLTDTFEFDFVSIDFNSKPDGIKFDLNLEREPEQKEEAPDSHLHG